MMPTEQSGVGVDAVEDKWRVERDVIRNESEIN